MALISGRCSIGIGNILATHIIPQKVNLSPNELSRLLIPQQRKQFPNLSYSSRGFHSKKKMLHTVRAASEEASEWAKTDNRRFLHATYRVTDLERSIKYYTEVFGMKLLERRNLIGQSSAFVGFGAQDSNFVLELFYRTDDPAPFDIGNGFGHFGISTPDVKKYVEEIKAKGGIIVPPPTNYRAFLNEFAEDPDGYLFELLERDIDHLRLSHLNLSITNLESSTKFYTEALGMKILWENLQPENALRLMGYSDEVELVDSYEKLPTNFLELIYRANGPEEYSKGNAYSHLSIGTDDVNKSAEALNLLSEELRPNRTRETDQSSTTKSTVITFLDPDSWKIVFFDNAEVLKEVEANQ